MQLNYHSISKDQAYLSRVFLFVRRNYWLYLPDALIVLLLIIPPYTWGETKVLIPIILIIFIRDIIILNLSFRHLGKFVAKGNEVSIGILNMSKMQKERIEWLPELDLEIKYSFGIPILHIIKGNEVIFKQYPFGSWSLLRMTEFVESFYDYKKEQALWKMFKGQE